MSKMYSQQYKSDSSIQESPQFSFFHQDQFMSSETESQQLFENFTQHLTNRQAMSNNNFPYSTNNLEKTVMPECTSQKSLCVYDMFHQYKEHDIHSISTLFKRNSNKEKMTLKQMKIENEIKKKKQQCFIENKSKELSYDEEEEEQKQEELQQEEYQISTKRRKNISQQNKISYNSTSPRVQRSFFQSKLTRSVKQNSKNQNFKYLKQLPQLNFMLENQNISTSQDFSSQSNSEQNYDNKQQFDILKYEDYQERNKESSFNDSSSQQILVQKMVNVSFQQDTENQLMFGEEFPYNQSVIEQLDEESQNEMKLSRHQSKLNKNYKPIHKRMYNLLFSLV